MKILILALLLGLCGCSHGGDDGIASIVTKSDCPQPLVVLPDNFIIDLAAGSEVELNPSRQQFALFCSVREAREALEADLAANRIQGKDRWRIYSLNGAYEDLARPCGNGQVCLAIPATLSAWVD